MNTKMKTIKLLPLLVWCSTGVCYAQDANPTPHPEWTKFQEHCKHLERPKSEFCESPFKDVVSCSKIYNKSIPEDLVVSRLKTDGTFDAEGDYQYVTICQAPNFPEANYVPHLSEDKDQAYENALRKLKALRGY